MYQAASLFLYKQLSGDSSASLWPPADAKIYFSFKPQMLGRTKDSNGNLAAVSYIRDPFGNSYGYSTAYQKVHPRVTTRRTISGARPLTSPQLPRPRRKIPGSKTGRTRPPAPRRLPLVCVDCDLDTTVCSFAVNLSVEFSLRRIRCQRSRRNQELG